jgi:hypothetical protein
MELDVGVIPNPAFSNKPNFVSRHQRCVCLGL